MEARSPARYLAPIALVVTIAGAYLIVHHGTSDRGSAAAQQRVRALGHASAARNKRARRFYFVQAGDNLSAIAAKAHVSLTSLETLNPLVDPNSLQTGQRIRLRQ